MKKSKDEEKKLSDKSVEDKEDWEAKQNLIGVFSILFEVDKRINPSLYKKKSHTSVRAIERKYFAGISLNMATKGHKKR